MINREFYAWAHRHNLPTDRAGNSQTFVSPLTQHAYLGWNAYESRINGLLNSHDYASTVETLMKLLRVRDGWSEAVTAWATCAAIHMEFAKDTDAIFKTRQDSFYKSEKRAREKMLKFDLGTGKQRRA